MNGELDQLGERIAEQAAHLDAAMHRLLTDLREFDARGGWYVQGAATCAHWLAWRVGWDLVTARDHVRVARKLAEFALIDDALRRGEVSYSKVRAMLRVATPANEALLLDHARLMTASQLEKLCRKYALVQRHDQDSHPEVDEQRRYVRRRDLEDGMIKIEAVLHSEEAELVWTMLDHAASRLAREAAAAATPAGGTAHQDSAESAGTGDEESPHAESASAESPAAAEPCCAIASAPAEELVSVESALGTVDAESSRVESDSAESPAAAEPCCAAANGPAGTEDSPESAGAGDGESLCVDFASAEWPAAAEPCGFVPSIGAGRVPAGRTVWAGSSTVACSVEGWAEGTGSATVGCTTGEGIAWTGPTQAGDPAACSEVVGRPRRGDRFLRAEPVAEHEQVPDGVDLHHHVRVDEDAHRRIGLRVVDQLEELFPHWVSVHDREGLRDLPCRRGHGRACRSG